jgi:glycolate oxidase FAD binding subunit
VTGYDLSKLLTGSHGTLAALTSLTVKVMPAPEEERTIALIGPGAEEGLHLMRRALGGAYAISGAAYLPGWATASYDHRPVVFLRIEGFAASVAARLRALCALVREHGEVLELDGEASADVWRTFRQLGPALADDADDLWRLSLPPMAAADLARSLEGELGARYWLDWAGGLLWLLVPPGDHAALIRDRVSAAGGHATCLRGRAGGAPFHPLEAGKLALTRRIKAGFDPMGLFNPGRMYEGV